MHLINPRDVVPESNMPAFPWLADNELEPRQIVADMRAQKAWFGVPYSEQQLNEAASKLEGKTQMDAVIAYLQSLGTNVGRGAR